MPSITDPPPPELRADIARLRGALDEAVPPRLVDRNLLIATWNIRAFGGLTERWRAGADDSPKRDLGALRLIGEILSRFDVIAVQEVRGNLKALRHLLRLLGPEWAILLTDVTQGGAGNDERLAFLFDTRRVKPSGLACELVLPPEWLAEAEPDALRRQFARTPYAASFISGGETFILVTLHVLYGEAADERTGELRAIARWLADWARETHGFGQSLIALGDFNIDREGDPNWEALTSTGLRPAPGLAGLTRTIFDDPGRPDEAKRYDQVAWFTGEGGSPEIALRHTAAGRFDFVGLALRDLDRNELSWRISDHYPLWTEFALPGI